MSPSPKVLVKDEEEGLVKAAGVKDEQPEHRTYKSMKSSRSSFSSQQWNFPG